MCNIVVIGWGMIGLGATISFFFLLLRIAVPRQDAECNRKFQICFIASVVGVLLAVTGFCMLMHADPVCGKDYSTVLKVLALLSAGVIAGFFAFSFEKAATTNSEEYDPSWLKLEICIPNILSICFTLSLYLLFGSICYYMGQSQEVHEAKGISWLVPLIMFLILLGNVCFDYWDYAIAKKKNTNITPNKETEQ